MKSIRILCIFILALCAVFLSTADSAALAENSNDISSAGLFAYRNGYMYFVSEYWTDGRLNDGRETGRPNSVEFWRIADAPGAQKELVGSLPAADVSGLVLSPGKYLAPVDGAIYFVREWPQDIRYRVDDQLMRLDTVTGKAEHIENIQAVAVFSSVYVTLPFFTDGNQMYFRSNDNKMMMLDMQANAVSQWSPPESVSQRVRSESVSFRPGTIFDIQDGYIYYPETYPFNPEDCGISRMPVSGGDREIIIPRLSDYEEASGCFVQGELLYLFSREALYCIDIPSGTTVEQFALGENLRFDNDYGSTLNIADGKIYYLKENGLYAKTVGLDDETLLVSGNTEGIECLTLGENYFYCHDSYRRCYFRLPVSARFFEEAEVLLEENPEPSEEQYQNENGWLYFEYENCVTIGNYIGEDTSAAAPTEIHGKPVISVALDPYSYEERPLQTLTVPEGVLRLEVLGSDNLTYISLPLSLLKMSNGGYPYVFATADGCVVQYAGTKDEWQALEDRSWTDGGVWKFNDAEVTVLCSDGQWTEPESSGGSY